MKIGQYCQRQRCKHVELEQFLAGFRVARFVSDSWAFLLFLVTSLTRRSILVNVKRFHRIVSYKD